MADQDDNALAKAEEELDHLDELFKEWFDLQQKKVAGDRDKLDLGAERRLWELTVEALKLMAKWFDRNERLISGPEAISLQALFLRNTSAAIRNALDGHLPITWRGDPRGRTSTPLSIGREIQRMTAAAYNRARREGLFTDEKNNKFLKDTFRVKSRRTIDNWSEIPLDEGFYGQLREYLLKIDATAEDADQLRRKKAREWVMDKARLARSLLS